MNKINPLRLLTAMTLLVLLALPLSAQEKQDSVFTFRFLSGKDMFFSPGMNNGEELARLFDCVDRYKKRIHDHEIYLHVDGFYKSQGGKSDSRNLVRTRSNRVKSELITRKGLKEGNFVTRNQAGPGNYVTVRFVPVFGSLFEQQEQVSEPAASVEDDEIFEEQHTELPTDSVINVTSVQEPAEECTTVETVEDVVIEETSGDQTSSGFSIPFALKTNLLDYAVLMPNIEIEWMFANRWSATFEVQGAWYAKKEPHKVYRLATWMPEVRYWVIDRARWHGMYVGIFGGPGIYDLCNGTKGHEGEGGMVGISAGYMWPISKHLSLEAGLGIGYMRLRDKSYEPRDGHFLYQMTKNINYFGPLRLKLSLVWRLENDKTNRKK